MKKAPKPIKKYTFVYVLPNCRNYGMFQNGFYGIIEKSGSLTEYSSGDTGYEYSVYILNKGRIVNSTAWVQDHMITVFPKTRQNRLKALELEDKYKSFESKINKIESDEFSDVIRRIYHKIANLYSEEDLQSYISTICEPLTIKETETVRKIFQHWLKKKKKKNECSSSSGIKNGIFNG